MPDKEVKVASYSQIQCLKIKLVHLTSKTKIKLLYHSTTLAWPSTVFHGMYYDFRGRNQSHILPECS